MNTQLHPHLRPTVTIGPNHADHWRTRTATTSVKVPVDAVLDYYTQQHINGNLQQHCIDAHEDPKRMELIDCGNQRDAKLTTPMFRCRTS